MRAVLLACALLVASVAVAPGASAAAGGSACDKIIDDPPQACYTAEAIALAALGYALCFYNTAPAQWVSQCV